MVIMGLKRFSNKDLTSIIKAAGTLQFDDDMLLDRTSQQLMLSVHKMAAEELYNLVRLDKRCSIWQLTASPARESTV